MEKAEWRSIHKVGEEWVWRSLTKHQPRKRICSIPSAVSILFRFWRHLIAEKHQQPKGPLKTTMPNEAVSLTTSMFITKDTCSFMYIRWGLLMDATDSGSAYDPIRRILENETKLNGTLYPTAEFRTLYATSVKIVTLLNTMTLRLCAIKDVGGSSCHVP